MLPPAITPAGGRPERCTVTVPGDTGSVGDVAPHRQQASSRIWRVATSPTRVLQAQITQRCTRSVAIHPIRRGAMPTDRVHRLPQQAQLRAIPLHRPQPAASDAATWPRHAHPGSEREALHQLGSVAAPPSWCNTTKQHAQSRALPPDTPQPAASDAATRPRNNRTDSAQEPLHPLRRCTPVTSLYTRSEEVQCLRIGYTASSVTSLHVGLLAGAGHVGVRQAQAAQRCTRYDSIALGRKALH